MSYLIIADWDDDLHPTRINTKNTLAEADALVDKLKNDMPPGKEALNSFHVLNPHVKAQYIIVDPVAKTITVDTITETTDKNDSAFAELRLTRNRFLHDTDWTDSPKNALTGEQHAAWEAYRTELRNLPANTPDPADPTWPVAPA